MRTQKIIVFGFGGLYNQRKKSLYNMYDVKYIIDNNRELWNSENSVPVLQPQELNNIPSLPILIMSDHVSDIAKQISNIIGSEDAAKRIRLGRLSVPVAENEIVMSGWNYEIIIEENRANFVKDNKYSIVLQESKDDIKYIYREITKLEDSTLMCLINMPILPVCSNFGAQRGKPLDRYYIERFLNDNKYNIRGVCLEIAENTYTKKFGDDRVTDSIILHVEGWGNSSIKGNLETGEGIDSHRYDTMIITQTLMFTSDIHNTIKNIYKGLKDRGYLLLTTSGISQIARYDDDNWGMFYSFYKKGLDRLFASVFGEYNYSITTYGNAKIAIGMLYGVVVEDLKEEDFEMNDPDYPVIYGVLAWK